MHIIFMYIDSLLLLNKLMHFLTSRLEHAMQKLPLTTYANIGCRQIIAWHTCIALVVHVGYSCICGHIVN